MYSYQVLLPALAKARELANRAVCMANIRGIVQSMVTYAQSNNGTFPAPTGGSGNTYFNNPPVQEFGSGGTSVYSVNTTGTPGPVIQYMYATGYGGNATRTPTAGMWCLVLQGYTSPASFICPSDPIGSAATSLAATKAGGVLTYFGNFSCLLSNGQTFVSSGMYNPNGLGLSYSFAFPWPWENSAIAFSPGQWWTTNGANTQVPLVSDMAPVDGGATGVPASAGDSQGNGVYQRITTTLPTANTYGPYIYNSGNHAGDGQNVGFGDDHVTWETSPYVGQNGDNIFTYTTATGVVNGTTDASQVGVSAIGFAPAPEILTLAPPFDTCMTPVRTVNPTTAAQGTTAGMPGGTSANAAW